MESRYKRHNRRKYSLKVHIQIAYDTTDRVYDIVKVIKQQTTYYLWQKYIESQG